MQLCPKLNAHPPEIGECLHLAIGVQHPADARLRAAAANLTELALRLLTTPNLTAAELDSLHSGAGRHRPDLARASRAAPRDLTPTARAPPRQ